MTITFDHLLELIDGRSASFRSALAGALDERVPGCPDWTGRDLLAHLGEVQRFWTQAVVAGKPDGPPDDADVPERSPTGDLLDWSERSTAGLLQALRDAGPDRSPSAASEDRRAPRSSSRRRARGAHRRGSPGMFRRSVCKRLPDPNVCELVPSSPDRKCFPGTPPCTLCPA